MSYFADKQPLVADIFSRYPDSPQGRRSALMPLLREVQDAEGFVSGSRMDEIAALCGTTATEVRSVMSFYSTYHTLPTGKYHLQVCSTVMCSLAGSDELWDHLVAELDVQPGEVSPDGRFSVQKVECLGSLRHRAHDADQRRRLLRERDALQVRPHSGSPCAPICSRCPTTPCP